PVLPVNEDRDACRRQSAVQIGLDRLALAGEAQALLRRDARGGRHQGTGSSSGLPSMNALMFSAARTAMRVRVRVDAEAMCGRSTALSRSSKAGSTAGSRSYTSSPAP